MDFFCLPIIFGCSTKLSPEGDPSPRICPRCNNAAVIQCKSREWFELCWIPLIPMSSQHIWHCNICQWQVHTQPGWEPMRPGDGFAPGWQNQAQQGPPPGSNPNLYPQGPPPGSHFNFSPQPSGYGPTNTNQGK